MTRLIAIALFCAALAACGKKAPEEIPQPKAGGAAPDAAVSTAPAAGKNLLAAPGNYVRNAVGQIEKAKAAKVLYEKTAEKELNTSDLESTGGN